MSEGQFNQVLLYEMDAIRKVLSLTSSTLKCLFCALVLKFTEALLN